MSDVVRQCNTEDCLVNTLCQDNTLHSWELLHLRCTRFDAQNACRDPRCTPARVSSGAANVKVGTVCTAYLSALLCCSIANKAACVGRVAFWHACSSAPIPKLVDTHPHIGSDDAAHSVCNKANATSGAFTSCTHTHTSALRKAHRPWMHNTAAAALLVRNQAQPPSGRGSVPRVVSEGRWVTLAPNMVPTPPQHPVNALMLRTVK